jgi:hypothetical protein
LDFQPTAHIFYSERYTLTLRCSNVILMSEHLASWKCQMVYPSGPVTKAKVSYCRNSHQIRGKASAFRKLESIELTSVTTELCRSTRAMRECLKTKCTTTKRKRRLDYRPTSFVWYIAWVHKTKLDIIRTVAGRLYEQNLDASLHCIT